MSISKNIRKTFVNLTDTIGLSFSDDDEYEEELLEDTNPVIQKKEVSSSSIKENLIVTSDFDSNEIVQSSIKTSNLSKQTNNEENSCQTIFVNPKSFSECKKIADYIKENKVVTLNLESISPKDAQRILDFLSGAISIKDAKWIPISKYVFAAVPKNVKFLYEGEGILKQNLFLDINHNK